MNLTFLDGKYFASEDIGSFGPINVRGLSDILVNLSVRK